MTFKEPKMASLFFFAADRCEVQVEPDVHDATEALESAQRLADRCTKNPGHTEFIPINDLTLQDLPAAFRSERTLNCLKHEADMTVKLTVRYSSPDRPKKFRITRPGSTQPCVGTGRVLHLLGSDVRRYRTGGVFEVTTVAHVVYDDAEARQTTVEFFFDDVSKSRVVEGRGFRVLDCRAEDDQCRFLCEVKDKNAAESIRRIFKEGSTTANELTKGIRVQVCLLSYVIPR